MPPTADEAKAAAEKQTKAEAELEEKMRTECDKLDAKMRAMAISTLFPDGLPPTEDRVREIIAEELHAALPAIVATLLQKIPDPAASI
jgi:hypothetical protein